MKHFLPENTQDQMNAFDGKKVDFFAKNLKPLKTRGCPTNPIPNPEVGETLGRKIKQNNLYYSLYI